MRIMPNYPGRLRLSSLMFLQLFANGAVLPFLSYYLTAVLGFTGVQSGAILAVTALSSLVGPFLGAYVIDRLMHAKHLYLLSMATMAAASLFLLFVRDFWSVLVAVLFLYLSFGPALNILHSVTFQTMKGWPGGTNHFGSVRVWGTIGWICCGFCAAGVWLVAPFVLPGHTVADQKALAFLLSLVGSVLCMVAFAALPKGELRKEGRPSLLPPEAVAVLRRPVLIGLSTVFLVSQICESFYYFGQGPYLASLGVAPALIPAVLTVGQALEIPMLFGFAALLKRAGFFQVFCLGAGAQLLRYVLFLTGVPWLGILALALNGVIFACLMNAITMFIDKHADDRSRSGVHQLLGLFVGGTSWLVGSLLSGFFFDRIDPNGLDYSSFWMVPLVGSLAVAVFVVVLRKPTLASTHNRP